MDHSAAMVMFELFNNGLVHSSDPDFIKKVYCHFFRLDSWTVNTFLSLIKARVSTLNPQYVMPDI